MKSKTTQKMAMFIIFLVLTMPFYSASAIASAQIQITKNTGSAGVDGFLDANGDTWQVVVDIAGIETAPTPEQLILNVGTKSQRFDACSDSAVGFTCTYTSPLPITLTEKSYTFSVKYMGTPTDAAPPTASKQITADGSAPTVTGLTLKQEKNADSEGTHILMDFTVTEQPNSGAGIKTIEVLNADTNQILQTIEPQTPAQKQLYKYHEDTNHNSQLEVELSGEGQKRIKVRATDALGHITSVPPIASFKTDFISPVIDTATARLVDSQNFIGQTERFGTFEVNVTDTNLLSDKVTASADGTDLDNKEGSCVNTDSSTYTCTWPNVRLTPQASYTLVFHAQDELGNVASASATITLVQDTTAPEIIFFGTNHVFEDQSYVTRSDANDNQKVILIAQEQGSGITPETVAANLAQLQGGTMQKPDKCFIPDGEANYRCEWDIKTNSLPDKNVIITLPKFQDAVENVGASREASIRVDTGGPVVDKISFFGVSDAGEKDYFQSNDRIKIKFNVTEQSGLDMYIDMHDLIGFSEADQQFLPTANTPENKTGYMHFDQTNCERKVDQNANGEEVPTFVWECTIETVGLKSGPAHPSFEFILRDTAGNDAQKWNYESDSDKIKNMEGRGNRFNFELLGLAADEENPDFWQVQSAAATGFIDLETTNLIPARIPIDVTLSSKTARTEAINIEVQGCAIDTSGEAPTTGPSVVNTASQKAADAEATTEATAVTEEAPGPAANLQISRTILYGGNTPDIQEGESTPHYLLLLEFAPFDGKEQFVEQFKNQVESDNTIDIPIVCNVQIFSKVGSNAIRNPEMEAVKFTVPFSFSSLGAMDENLKNRIDGAKDWIFKFADWGPITTINKILVWVNYLTMILRTLNSINAIISAFSSGTDVLRVVPPGYAAAIGVCEGATTTQGVLSVIIEPIQFVTGILSCSPNAPQTSWVSNWQQMVLKVYNGASGRGQIGAGATGLSENLYTSMIGLCVPGMLQNLEKYRQVRCREIMCYKNEVPQGVATLDSCKKLADYLDCRFWMGPLFDFTPLAAIDAVGQWIASIIRNPWGLVRPALLIPCAINCAKSTALTESCKWSAVFVHGLDIWETVENAINSWPGTVSDQYCSQI